jgi:hypothetical protein
MHTMRSGSAAVINRAVNELSELVAKVQYGLFCRINTVLSDG